MSRELELELDIWIAEHVMGCEVGWERYSLSGRGSNRSYRMREFSKTKFIGLPTSQIGPGPSIRENAAYQSRVVKGRGYIPRYSTNISAAFEAVEKLVRDGWHFSLTNPGYTPDRWMAQFYTTHVAANTPAMAICLAARAALESTQPTKEVKP